MNDAKEGKAATEKTPHNSPHQPLLFDLAQCGDRHIAEEPDRVGNMLSKLMLGMSAVADRKRVSRSEEVQSSPSKKFLETHEACQRASV